MTRATLPATGQRPRTLVIVVVLCWLVAGVVAMVAPPWPVGVGVAVLGAGLTAALWFELRSHAHSAGIPAEPSLDLPRALESIDPVEVFDRESAEIERLREVELQLRLAKQEAEAATLAKGEFLATMSHEIRTPLNGIVPLIDVVLSTGLDGDQRQCLETAYSSAQQLLSIVDDILDYSKMEANKLELESVTLNLREVAESVARLMAHPAQAKNVALRVEFDPTLRPIMRGDPVRLRQVLTNLLSNAVKFTERGCVSLRINKRGETATHSQVLFAVVDTGAGIAAEAQKRLFQPFMQADTSVTRVFGGTGLGLAICRRLVEVMGGEIGVESAPDQGSTFWFSVPLLKAPGDIVSAGPASGEGRALVVSADKLLIAALAGFFSNAGLEHTQTSLSADAVSRLRGNPTAPRGGHTGGYQFVFLDWTGMRLTAQSLARGLLRDPSLAHLKLVLLTRPGDEVPDDLSQHAQVLIHPRALDPGKLRAALDSGGGGEAASMSVAEMLRAGPFPNSVAEASQTVESVPQHELRHSREVLPTPAGPRAASVAANTSGPTPPPPAPVRPRRVLLVEDNAVNRQVAQRLLSIGGLTVDVAEDGSIAVSKRFAEPPLLLLMDCQMPVMDGYAATRAIREREARENLPRMPIIAMTANAMLGDREKCLQAGMDDYLSKPLNRKILNEVLDRWLAVAEGRTTVMAKRREVVSLDLAAAAGAAPAGAASTSTTRPAPPTRPAAPVVAPPAAPSGQVVARPTERSAVAASAGLAASATAPATSAVAAGPALDQSIVEDLLEIMGDDFPDLVRIFLQDAPGHVAAVRAAAERDDIAALVAPAHILKSSSANLGAMMLSKAAREIESGARLGKLPRPARELAAQLEGAFASADIELTQLVSGASLH